jgi:hypothetical protein
MPYYTTTTNKKYMNKHTVSVIVLATLLAATAQSGQEKLAQSIKEAQSETYKTSEQLRATLESINALTKQTKGDLRPVYDAYCAQVALTGTAANSTRARVQWMAGEGRAYFQDWQKTVEGINNEGLRKKAQKRLNSVKESFDKIEESLKTASEKFKPFLSDLADMQKTLATDVTPGGVKAIKGTVSSANWDHKFVNQAITAALKDMGKMSKALSSQAE